ncbi:hypothetical protein BBJ29_001445 [Phytophthora kernoviae]|uniref:RRM domain-containing protein n=1 Tax=Phytophthora kernoviae TaxID=325452 RepID=A0A3F2S0R9_9STRA|nr:hypothetical protein BBP00_00001262 [Phytophthora kernoviae]RLN69832.1 hypothetical protein BBJ29_001445 [Phytophthora kernoviae]
MAHPDVSPGMKRQLESTQDFDVSKRQRGAQLESRVVFVRGLPTDCLESELLALCCPFAVVEKSLMVPQKCQAFVQLPDISSAANLITFYQTRDALIRGKKIYFEFSNRDEINGRSEGGMIPHDGPRRGIGPPNQILMVSVSKIEYDVTVDVLQQVFQKFGNVEKIVTFWKDNEFKSLVQMESIDQAQAAQAALDGREIYTGCNQLSIVFSRHPELRIMFRKRDTALIQFVDDVHSTSALDHLDGVYVFGKKLRVDFSKHTSVSMPHADADRFEIENTLDFSGSPLHRYRRRSPQEAVSPCPLLHISGIPMELQRNQNALVDLFTQFGYVKDFRYLQNNKMALIEMGSVDEAIMALLQLDNMSYPDSHMRVSFSKAYQYTVGAGPSPGPGTMPGPRADSAGWNPPMQPHPRDRSRDRTRNRDRIPPPGDRDRSFRDRGPPPQRGRDYQPRDNSRRPPPRY